MMSQSVGYAATALGYIEMAGGKPVLVREIAERAGIPQPYLAKIINMLARRRLVVTQRGIGGGVTLARPAHQITLYEVCDALDDPIVQERCMMGTAECSDERACPCHHFWKDHRGREVEFLRTATVSDIAAFESRRAAGEANGVKAPVTVSAKEGGARKR